MPQYYLYVQILGSENIPKSSYTVWVGPTPIGFAKKGDIYFDKKKGYFSKCVWSMEIKKDFDRTSLELILKHHKLLGGESEYGRLQLPLKWFPSNAVVKDWFPISSKFVTGTDGQQMMFNLAVHLSESSVSPFSAPAGSLLVAPAWNRPGCSAVPPTHLVPSYPPPQGVPPYPGYIPQQGPPPQPYPNSPVPPPVSQVYPQPQYPQQSFPQYPSQTPPPMPNQSFQQYPSDQRYPQEQITVIADSNQPAYAPPFMYSPTVSPTISPAPTPPGSVGMPMYPSPTDPQMQANPVYMPPPIATPYNDPSNSTNPYAGINPNDLPSATPTQQNQDSTTKPPEYPNVPVL